MKTIIIAIIFLSLISTHSLLANQLNDNSLIPHVGKNARESYISFLYSDEHRAFAIGPGGAWAWKSGFNSEEQASEAAVEACENYTDQTCIPYAVNTSLVFDKKQWIHLWGPYKSLSEVSKSQFGNQRGQRFYNLKFENASGKEIVISDLLGKIVLVHFWGSWCPSCMNEYPSLYRMRKILNEKMGDDFEIVILQAREPYEKALNWVEKNRYTDMPLYNSGVKDEDDSLFTLANNQKIEDRKIANRFPSSFVLDRNGIVIFAHKGPVLNWLEYLPFFDDVYNKSNKYTAKKE
ncbi:MAG: TlpA family protein disulfide reductase [Gammaproteobacteria bacterium]|nr:TlpA family protein disulfide reductase [Gammaproteobacteria bacterium]